jgi:hypothetical protein
VAEYVKDNDGDVWTRDGAEDRWTCRGLDPRTLAQVTVDFGPVVPCAEDGTPVPSAPVVDVRGLVAAAFLDLAELASAWLFDEDDPVRYEVGSRVSSWAEATAEAVRRGDIRPVEVRE